MKNLKFFYREFWIVTTIIALFAVTVLFSSCQKPSGETSEPTAIVKEDPDPIPQSEFETPRTKNFGDFVMYDFEGSNTNITNSNVDEATSYYTRYSANKIDNLIKTFSDDAKANPLIQNAINRINEIDSSRKGDTIGYHDEVERAIAPIFQDMTKRNIELGDVDDRYNWEGCCRYMFNEAYGHGLGDRINENRPETEKYQAEQKKARMIVNTNDLVQYGNTRDEATANMINHYLVMLSADMSVPVNDLKTLFQMELINHANSPLFDLNKIWLGIRTEQTHCAINTFSNPYATLSQTREQ